MQSWIPLVPDSASTFSSKVDALYFYLSGVTLFFTLLISGMLIFFVIRYRRRTPYEIPRPVAGARYIGRSRSRAWSAARSSSSLCAATIRDR